MTFDSNENNVIQENSTEDENNFDNDVPMEETNIEYDLKEFSFQDEKSSTDFINFLNEYNAEASCLLTFIKMLDETLFTFKSKNLLTIEIKKAYIFQTPKMLDCCNDITSLIAVCSNLKSNFYFEEIQGNQLYLTIIKKIIKIAARVNNGPPQSYYNLVPNEIGQLIKMLTKNSEFLYKFMLYLIYEEIVKPVPTNKYIASYINIGAIISVLIDEKFLEVLNYLIMSHGQPEDKLVNLMVVFIDWLLLFSCQFKMNIVYAVLVYLKNAGYDDVIQSVADQKIFKIISMIGFQKSRLFNYEILIFFIQNNNYVNTPEFIQCFDRIQNLFINSTNYNNGQAIQSDQTIFLEIIKIFQSNMKNWKSPIRQKYESLFAEMEPKLKSYVGNFSKAVGMRGLINLGCTCYMNAVLQALFMISTFRKDVIEAKVESTTVTSKLQHLFLLLNYSKKNSIAPNEMYMKRPSNFIAGQQQDCCEYLQFLLAKIEEEKNKEMVTRYFYGETQVLTTCLNCKNNSIQTERFLQLNITIPTNIQSESVHLLDRFAYSLQKESMTDACKYECANCNNFTNAEKQTLLKNTPNILIFNILRYTASSTQKLLNSVILPLTIIIESQGQTYHYGLISIIHHTGSRMDSGHYFLTARRQLLTNNHAERNNIPKISLKKNIFFDEEGLRIESGEVDLFEDEWINFNDEHVDIIKSRNFLNSNSTPYVVFYSLITPTSLFERQPEINQFLLDYINSEEQNSGDCSNSSAYKQMQLSFHNSSNIVEDNQEAKNLDKNFLDGPSYIS